MKTYEWIIKIVSYILCCAAVCAGFAAKEKEARETLNAYTDSVRQQKTERLCQAVIRLKKGLSGFVSDETGKDALTEISYCCKAASDAVCDADGGKSSENLRLLFDRVGKICIAAYESGKDLTAGQRYTVSELYMRLSAVEDVLLSGKMSASELICALSAGLPGKEENGTQKDADRISMSDAEKRAAKFIGTGIRLKNCGMHDGNFVFSSDGSCIVLTGRGDPYIKSRTVTEGKEHIAREEAEKRAAEYIAETVGSPCRAEFKDKLFGIYYFSVYCDEKEYPVGVDKTDGKIVFEVISQ